jgi:hypothetical protein
MRKDTTMLFTMGSLLFLSAFIAPLVSEFKACAEYHYLPDLPRLIYAFLLGLSGALSTVVAFLNTGYARWKDKRQTEEKP